MFEIGNFFNGFVFADLDTGGDISGVTYQCNNLGGAPCVVEIITGNNDPILGDYDAVNFSACTPSGGSTGSCNPTSLSLTIESSDDNDQDGIPNLNDNCVDVANQTQTDTDNNGYGNACDGDYNNDCSTNFSDVSLFSDQFLGSSPLYDLNDDGSVNFVDYSVLVSLFLMPPGPGLNTGICEN